MQGDVITADRAGTEVTRTNATHANRDLMPADPIILGSAVKVGHSETLGKGTNTGTPE